MSIAPEIVELESQNAIEPEGEAHSLVLPGGRAVVLVHTGPFETLRETYAQLQAWMNEQRVQPATGMWECYLTDPVTEPDPARWQTKIVWPIV